MHAKGSTFQHSVGQRNDISDPPIHPIHSLQDDPELLEAVNEICQDVFRVSLTLDRLSQNATLRVGIPDVPAPPIDAVTSEYRAALINLIPVEQQGDGMRSFLSLLLPLITGISSLIIIDEPEAFLHPPQAFALGRAISELAKARNTQVVLATHDRNLLTGLFEPGDVDVSVVRVTNDGGTVTAHQLGAPELRSLWTDPTLSYTNVLEGLFHRAVVLCEAEQDCRFYGAALESLTETKGLAVAPSEVLFLPSGGKDGMPKLVRTLKQVHVPVCVTPDLDILDDESKIRVLVEAMGGDWSILRNDYRLATQPFRDPRQEVGCDDVLTAVKSVLESKAGEPFTQDVRKSVQSHMRVGESPWKALKRYGVSAFSGQSGVAANRLLSALDEMGIVLVRVGELEHFAPTLGVAKSSAWLPAALNANAHRDSAAQDHVERLANAF